MSLSLSQRRIGSVLFSRGFRPFFLLASGYAPALLLIWLGVLGGWHPAPRWLAPFWWHGHEMVFGFAVAAVAGFLLTAVPVWTGRHPLSGGGLAALAGLWLAGRGVMLAASHLPALAVAAVDLAFLPVLAAVLTPMILALGRRHNYGFPLVLLVMAGANGAMHAEALGLTEGLAGRGLRVAVDCLALLVVIVGGRIVPIFTRNAVRRAELEPTLRSWAWLDRTAVAGAGLVVAVHALEPGSFVSGAVALGAGVLLSLRLGGWQTAWIWRDPLVWSLHLGYAWTAVGFVLLGLSDLTGTPARTLGVHALAAGGFGTMILAVMSRVGLGHTGRALHASRATAAAYVLVTAGALVRVVGLAIAPGAPLLLLTVSGLLWASAYVVFATVYWPILLRPRAGGRPA